MKEYAMPEPPTDGTSRSAVSDKSDAPDDARNRLFDGFQRMLAGNGAYKFLLLRESPMDQSHINGDDIDLLGTQESIRAFLRHARELNAAGQLNFRVVTRSPNKVQLALYSVDGELTKMHFCLYFVKIRT